MCWGGLGSDELRVGMCFCAGVRSANTGGVLFGVAKQLRVFSALDPAFCVACSAFDVVMKHAKGAVVCVLRGLRRVLRGHDTRKRHRSSRFAWRAPRFACL